MATKLAEIHELHKKLLAILDVLGLSLFVGEASKDKGVNSQAIFFEQPLPAHVKEQMDAAMANLDFASASPLLAPRSHHKNTADSNSEDSQEIGGHESDHR